MIQIDRMKRFFEDNEKKIAKYTEQIYLLGNPIKFKILWLIYKKDVTVKDIAIIMGMTQSAVSQHLTKLKESKMIEGTKKRKNVFYKLHPEYEKTIKKVLNDFQKSLGE